MQPARFPHPEFPDCELIDSGAGEKLERYGPVTVRRPDPQALWSRRAPAAKWDAAHLTFERDPDSGGQRGHWRASGDAPALARGDDPSWTVSWREVTCVVRPTSFKHLGLFPEQAANWAWIEERARALDAGRPRLLNLFGYTGAASLVALRAGFAVTHVDASRTSVAWTRENAAASGLGQEGLRVVVDDALGFARREARREARYEGILLDPPHHGKGPKGERWQFEERIAELLEVCSGLLAERAFLVLSTYAFGTSPLALAGLLGEIDGGNVEAGELALPESHGGRFLPAGFCARMARGFPPGCDG